MNITGIETRIPFLDLSRQHSEIQAELDDAIRRVLSKANFILGEEVEHFESEWAEYCGSSDCVGVANGTDALSLALLASGSIIPGNDDEVITSAISAGYTPLAILQAGAVPVFADVDAHSLLIHPRSLESAITAKTKAIVPVHLYGQICDMEAIRTIGKSYNLNIVEDAAQAHGAWRAERDSPSTAAFSFYPTKNLGACGDGGAIVSNDPDLIAKVKLLRQGGQHNGMRQRLVGRNSRLDEIQAAVLRVKLRRLNKWNERRRLLADFYDDRFEDCSLVARVRARDSSLNANHFYVVHADSRSGLQAHLRNARIQTLVHYPEPLHLQPLFEAGRRFELPIAETMTTRILSLPLNSHSFDWEIEEIARAVTTFFD